jgi:hypothetical protein
VSRDSTHHKSQRPPGTGPSLSHCPPLALLSLGLASWNIWNN